MHGKRLEKKQAEPIPARTDRALPVRTIVLLLRRCRDRLPHLHSVCRDVREDARVNDEACEPVTEHNQASGDRSRPQADVQKSRNWRCKCNGALRKGLRSLPARRAARHVRAWCAEIDAAAMDRCMQYGRLCPAGAKFPCGRLTHTVGCVELSGRGSLRAPVAVASLTSTLTTVASNRLVAPICGAGLMRSGRPVPSHSRRRSSTRKQTQVSYEPPCSSLRAVRTV